MPGECPPAVGTFNRYVSCLSVRHVLAQCSTGKCFTVNDLEARCLITSVQSGRTVCLRTWHTDLSFDPLRQRYPKRFVLHVACPLQLHVSPVNRPVYTGITCYFQVDSEGSRTTALLPGIEAMSSGPKAVVGVWYPADGVAFPISTMHSTAVRAVRV